MIILTLLLRDLRSRLRDRSALVLALFAPAALMTVLSFLVEGPGTQGIPVGIVTSPAPISAALIDGPLQALEDDGTITLREYADEAGARTAVESEKIGAAVVVSADGAHLQVLTSPDSIVAGAVLESITQATARTSDGITRGVLAQRSLGGTTPPQELAAAILAEPATARVADATEATGAIDPKTQIAAGMATFFLFFTVQFGVLGLLEERRQGTLPRLLAAPVAPWQILTGKLLVSLTLGLASMTALIAFSAALLGAHWGNPFGVALLVVAGVMAATATVTLVVGLARTSDQAGAIQSGLALVLGILGGSFFSMARAGGIAAFASRLTPHYWFNEGLVRMTGGQDWTAALPAVGALLLFAGVIGIPGMMLAGRTVRA
jgi:ABC-2 type transport system permease protein